ncbi:MAG: hypothetical protein IJ458_04815 [Clostridia bacterium]|nr:hypothetical protein [Clostridia bacterium]
MKKTNLLKSLCAVAVAGTLLISGCSILQPHQHEHTKSQIVNPTQTEMGYTLHTCYCGETFKDNYTCLITFENSESSNTSLPQIEPQIVSKDSIFNGVANVDNYYTQEYRNYITDSFYTNLYPGQIISNCCTIQLVWNSLLSAPTQTQLDFASLIQKIAKLEEISKQYNIDKNSTADPQIRVMQYIRQSRYSGFIYNAPAGTIESDFAQYVIDNQFPLDIQSLQTINTITIPTTGEQVDFVHMMYTINVIALNGIDPTDEKTLNNFQLHDLAGWGGDLCQLAKELKTNNVADDQLVNQAISLFNSVDSSFSCYDVRADFDAINIAKLYNTLASNKSISYAMTQYYGAVNANQRKVDVLLNAFPEFINAETGELTKTQTEMTADIITRLSSNSGISGWCMMNSLNFTTDALKFSAVANAFANHFVGE